MNTLYMVIKGMTFLAEVELHCSPAVGQTFILDKILDHGLKKKI